MKKPAPSFIGKMFPAAIDDIKEPKFEDTIAELLDVLSEHPDACENVVDGICNAVENLMHKNPIFIFNSLIEPPSVVRGSVVISQLSACIYLRQLQLDGVTSAALDRCQEHEFTSQIVALANEMAILADQKVDEVMADCGTLFIWLDLK